MAYSVLVVDDELLMRIQIKDLIGKTSDYRICAEAEDGREALEFINLYHPDIVLLDLSMPVMDGLEVLRAVGKNKNAPRFLVLSCHDEFRMVREALTSGAQDYLLKNSLDYDTMLEALDKQAACLGTASHGRASDVPDERLEDKNLYCITWLKHFFGGTISADRFSDFFSIRSVNCCCILFFISDYARVASRYADNNMDFMLDSMFNIFKNSLDKAQRGEFYQLEENLYIFLTDFSEQSSLGEIHSVQRSILQKFSYLARLYLNVTPVFGVGEICPDFGALRKSYQHAQKALEVYFFTGHTVIFYVNRFSEEISEEGFAEISGRALSYCLGKEYAKLREYLEVVHQCVSREEAFNYPSPGQFKGLYTRLAELITANEHLESVETDYAAFETYEEMQKSFLSVFYDTIGLGGLSEADHVTKDVLRYLQAHYREDISVAQIAQRLGMSENYLSRTFNKSMGMSIPNYINNYRMTKAQDYLRNTNMKIYEIADTLGYNSVSYFNTAFRRVTGITPAQYRNRNR